MPPFLKPGRTADLFTEDLSRYPGCLNSAPDCSEGFLEGDAEVGGLSQEPLGLAGT